MVTGDGSLYCWGDNSHGQLGRGTSQDAETPLRVEGLPPVADVSCDVLATCALLSTGAVACWGSNLFGKLGDGTDANRRRPTPVAVLR